MKPVTDITCPNCGCKFSASVEEAESAAYRARETAAFYADLEKEYQEGMKREEMHRAGLLRCDICGGELQDFHDYKVKGQPIPHGPVRLVTGHTANEGLGVWFNYNGHQTACSPSCAWSYIREQGLIIQNRKRLQQIKKLIRAKFPNGKQSY